MAWTPYNLADTDYPELDAAAVNRISELEDTLILDGTCAFIIVHNDTVNAKVLNVAGYETEAECELQLKQDRCSNIMGAYERV